MENRVSSSLQQRASGATGVNVPTHQRLVLRSKWMALDLHSPYAFMPCTRNSFTSKLADISTQEWQVGTKISHINRNSTTIILI